jgi:hypothetical protein
MSRVEGREGKRGAGWMWEAKLMKLPLIDSLYLSESSPKVFGPGLVEAEMTGL